MSKKWRCFHCDEVFTNSKEASLHFGETASATPVCQIGPKELRDMQEELSRYRDEDTDLHRQIANMQSQHQIALRQAEESGYSKGLRDGRNLKYQI